MDSWTFHNLLFAATVAAYCQLSFKAQLGLLRRDQFLRSCPLRDRVLRTRFRQTHKKYALRARRRASRTPRGNRKVSGIPPGQGANELLRAIPAPSKVVPASRQQKKLYGQLFARHKHFSWPCVYCVDAGPRPFKSEQFERDHNAMESSWNSRRQSGRAVPL